MGYLNFSFFVAFRFLFVLNVKCIFYIINLMRQLAKKKKNFKNTWFLHSKLKIVFFCLDCKWDMRRKYSKNVSILYCTADFSKTYLCQKSICAWTHCPQLMSPMIWYEQKWHTFTIKYTSTRCIIYVQICALYLHYKLICLWVLFVFVQSCSPLSIVRFAHVFVFSCACRTQINFFKSRK